MQQKIFVTGGTGFLGAYLLRYLVAKGYQNITALKRPNSPMDLVSPISKQIQWVEGDILDVPILEQIMKDVDQIYHCAAMVSFNPADKAQMLEINGTGTANIVNIALHYNIQKLVHISSIAAIGKEKDQQFITEATKWKEDATTTSYAKSKYVAEMEVWRGIAEGLKAAILNPSLILGSGFWDRGSGRIFKLYANGFPFFSGGIAGMVDVRDVAKCAIFLMESDIEKERFIINGENRAYRDLFTQIATEAGKKPPQFQINKWMMEVGWRLDKVRSFLTGRVPTVSKESIKNAGARRVYINQKSIDAFNIAYTPIQETVEATVKQYLDGKGQPMILPLY